MGRLVGLWSSVEGVAIFAVCEALGIPDAVTPLIAIVVGLHFLPLARGIPMPFYYASGVAVIAVGAGALLLPASAIPGDVRTVRDHSLGELRRGDRA